MEAKKILIVDDNQEILKLLQSRLEAEGYNTISASDGREALEKISLEKPDLLLLDIFILEIDGIDTLKILREKNPSLPVIIITAFPSEETLREAKKYGVSAYFKKPFQIEELREAIKESLEKKIEEG